MLSCGGGGVRGKITTTFLSLLEDDLKNNNMMSKNDDLTGSLLYDIFDGFAGTSTGSLISTALASGYNMERINEEFYNLDTMKNIFTYTWKSYIFKRKYRTDYLYNILDENFNHNINNLKKKLYIVTYNYTKRKPYIFSNDDSNNISDILKAAVAAPTYFPPYSINDNNYIDGTVCCNNPNTIVFNLLSKKYYELEEKIRNYHGDDLENIINNLNDHKTNKEIKITISSIIDFSKLKNGKLLFVGTGYKKPNNDEKNISSWGIFDWYNHNLIDLLMNGDEELNQIEAESNNYLHINCEIENDDIDNVSEDNFISLEEAGKNMYKKNRERVLEFLKIKIN